MTLADLCRQFGLVHSCEGVSRAPSSPVLEGLPQACPRFLPRSPSTRLRRRASEWRSAKSTRRRAIDSASSLVDEVTREPVESEGLRARDYEYSKNAYIPVEDEELDAIAVESNHTIEIDKFVPREQIDERYLDSPYYMLPNDQVGQEAFAVIREAMRGKGMVALGRVVLAKRERIIMLQPWGKGVMGATLRYGYEVRDQKEFFDDLPDVKIAPDMLKLAEHILASQRGGLRPVRVCRPLRRGGGRNAAGRSRQALQCRKGKLRARAPNVVNLMDALKRSLWRAAPAKKAEKAHRRPARNAAAHIRQEGRRGKARGTAGQ